MKECGRFAHLKYYPPQLWGFLGDQEFWGVPDIPLLIQAKHISMRVWALSFNMVVLITVTATGSRCFRVGMGLPASLAQSSLPSLLALTCQAAWSSHSFLLISEDTSSSSFLSSFQALTPPQKGCSVGDGSVGNKALVSFFVG